MAEAQDHIEDHGMALDKEKKRVKCKYCEKELSGFNRLKHHLGDVGSDVLVCEQVPADIKARMRQSLLDLKTERLRREVGELFHPTLPLKRTFSPTSNQAHENGLHKTMKPASSGAAQNLGDSKPTYTYGFANGGSSATFSVEGAPSVVMSKTEEDGPVNYASKCISRFFSDAGIDAIATTYPSFQRMISSIIGCGTQYKAPSYHDLKGRVFQEEAREVRRHVEEVRHSWSQTGCSILLDGWTNESGRSLISFLADCPKGTIFLRSVDASNSISDANALFSLVDGVIREVGVQNVVQVVTHDASCFLAAAGKMLMEKHETVCWSVCAAHCINLILEKIGMMGYVKEILDRARAITRFIYGNASLLELMRKNTRAGELVRVSEMKGLAAFLTLENIVYEREIIRNIFDVFKKHCSILASRGRGKRVVNLVENDLFWAQAIEVLKATIPLIHVLRSICGGEKSPIGDIYESMDKAKEAIKRDLGDDLAYLPLWDIIDDIWDNCLHSPLHCAGYYLNPSLFYSSDFHVDAEVTNGLVYCTVHMAEDRHKRLIVQQLDNYRTAAGGFGDWTSDERMTCPPDLWWAEHGGHSPELQRFAVRILSQTCIGASRYELNRSLSEQLHRKGRNPVDQQILGEVEFVQHNLRLWQSPFFGRDGSDCFVLQKFDPMNDWVGGWEASTPMDPDHGGVNIAVKIEQ